MSKRFFKPFAVLSILAILLAAVGVSPAYAAYSFTISGTIMTGNTGTTPAEGVVVNAVGYSNGSGINGTATTNAAGFYTMTIADPGGSHWHGVLTPSYPGNTGYAFSPVDHDYSGATTTNQVHDFTMIHGWQTGLGDADGINTPMPIYNPGVDLSTAQAMSLYDFGGCTAAPSFGNRQLHLAHTVLAGPTTYSYVRVRVAVPWGSIDAIVNSWAVLVSRESLGAPELGCAANDANGVVDFVVAIPADYGFIVTIANVSGHTPTAGAHFETWVFPTKNASGGMIINMAGDSRPLPIGTVPADNGDAAGRAVEASPAAGGAATWNAPAIFSDMQAFVDVPDGTYNLGIQDNIAGPSRLIAYYLPNQVVASPYYAVLTPDIAATRDVIVKTADESGNNVQLHIYADINDATFTGLTDDLLVGDSVGGTITFWVTPGAWGWDVAGVLDQDGAVNAPDYYLVARNINPVLGDINFNLKTLAHQVILPCWDDDNTVFDYDVATLLGLDPIGNLQARNFDIDDNDPAPPPVGSPVCPDGTDGQPLMLSGGYSYSGMKVRLEADDDWLYYFQPTVADWNFAGSAGVHAANYTNIFGDTPFLTATSAPANTDAPGPVTLTRSIWTDWNLNKLLEVTHPDGPDADLLPDQVMPVYTLQYGIDNVLTALANDWLTTSFTASVIGRYEYTACLAHGELPSLPNNNHFHPGDFCASAKEFALNPTDVHYGTDWAYHYIMSLYEKGLTSGTTATAFSPYLNTDRGQMAAFLANGFVKIAGQTLPAYAAAFTDVSSTDWFAPSVQYLKNLGITGGIGGGLYGPYLPVIRGDMAIFLEKTGQAVETINPLLIAWPVGLGTDLEYPSGSGNWFFNDPGIYNGWFTDVPASAYYATLVEEALADGLTGGCYAGTPYVNLQFCPTMVVDRSQMAVFMGRTWSLLEAPGFWSGPFPAPEPSK